VTEENFEFLKFDFGIYLKFITWDLLFKRMNILFIGDIVGRSGRQAVSTVLPELKKEYQIDFVIAQGENIARGKGLTFQTIKDLQEAGIDFFTAGNHVWKIKEFLPFLGDPKIPVTRGANYPEGAPGKGSRIVETAFGNLLIIQLVGREGISALLDDPFKKAKEILGEHKNDNILASIIDFHAEFTSEKNALAYFLDGEATAIFGTHTHIATCDQRILPKGTAFVTDVGMVGSLNSVLGVRPEGPIQHFLTALPQKFEVELAEPYIFNSVLLKIDGSGKAKSIERVDRVIDV